jgi:hypothetical protein
MKAVVRKSELGRRRKKNVALQFTLSSAQADA